MVFKCQDNSFLTEFTSNVIECNKVQIDEVIDGKTQAVEYYAVIFEDTILFPEGGGQPCDYGSIDEIPVKKVVRRKDKAIHFIPQPLEIGAVVKQKVDWERRFDHMQQHSGQHLLSAILEQAFFAQTVSWWLGEEVSHVELDMELLDADIRIAENKANELIRKGLKVTVTVYSEDIPKDLYDEVRSVKELPEDHKGDIRVVNIGNIDSNMCCGTHVTNLSQLQVIKLLHTEKSKRKDKILLYFLVGNRVLNKLSVSLDREKRLTTLLNNNPSQHVDLVEKLQKNYKVVNKNLQTVLKEVAISNANMLKNTKPAPKYFSMHKKEAEIDFMQAFIRELASTDVFLFLSTGDDKKEGNIILYGNEEAIAMLGPQICELLDGKGAGKGNTFRAKVTNMAKRKDAEKIISSYFSTAS